jgi:hypothetical protein
MLRYAGIYVPRAFPCSSNVFVRNQAICARLTTTFGLQVSYHIRWSSPDLRDVSDRCITSAIRSSPDEWSAVHLLESVM